VQQWKSNSTATLVDLVDNASAVESGDVFSQQVSRALRKLHLRINLRLSVANLEILLAVPLEILAPIHEQRLTNTQAGRPVASHLHRLCSGPGLHHINYRQRKEKYDENTSFAFYLPSPIFVYGGTRHYSRLSFVSPVVRVICRPGHLHPRGGCDREDHCDQPPG
jgi:hypothetical protein